MCCPQHVARPRNLLLRNMLRWCKRGLRALQRLCRVVEGSQPVSPGVEKMVFKALVFLWF